MEVRGYFFDSYALFEILRGNQNYLSLLSDISFALTRLNLLELHYHLTKRSGKKSADAAYMHFAPYAQEIPDEVIIEASTFRVRNPKKKLSYIDCIGYAFALKHGLTFLTGDESFRGVANVKFVK